MVTSIRTDLNPFTDAERAPPTYPPPVPGSPEPVPIRQDARLGEGRTRYTSDDTITGILAPLVMLVYGRPHAEGVRVGMYGAQTTRRRAGGAGTAPR